MVSRSIWPLAPSRVIAVDAAHTASMTKFLIFFWPRPLSSVLSISSVHSQSPASDSAHLLCWDFLFSPTRSRSFPPPLLQPTGRSSELVLHTALLLHHSLPRSPAYACAAPPLLYPLYLPHSMQRQHKTHWNCVLLHSRATGPSVCSPAMFLFQSSDCHTPGRPPTLIKLLSANAETQHDLSNTPITSEPPLRKSNPRAHLRQPLGVNKGVEV